MFPRNSQRYKSLFNVNLAVETKIEETCEFALKKQWLAANDLVKVVLCRKNPAV